MSDRRSSLLTRPWIALCAFLAITGFFLLTEHRAHLFGLLPYLLLLACPLLHLFLHGRHGHDEAPNRPASKSVHTLTMREDTDMTSEPAYSLWSLVLINSLVFIIFTFSFTRPRTARDWRSLGAFAAFIVALFTEMYGFPLTVYLLSGWLVSWHPGLDVFSHEAGHLWPTLLGIKAHSHFDLFHLLSSALIVGGFALLASAWSVLHEAQRAHALSMTGPYAPVTRL